MTDSREPGLAKSSQGAAQRREGRGPTPTLGTARHLRSPRQNSAHKTRCFGNKEAEQTRLPVLRAVCSGRLSLAGKPSPARQPGQTTGNKTPSEARRDVAQRPSPPPFPPHCSTSRCHFAEGDGFLLTPGTRQPWAALGGCSWPGGQVAGNSTCETAQKGPGHGWSCHLRMKPLP